MHICLYCEPFIQVLQKRTPNSEDRETLQQVHGLLRPLQFKLEEICKSNLLKPDSIVRMQSRARRQAALEKTSELQKSVDGWDQRDIGQCCNEFIRGRLLKSLGIAHVVFDLNKFTNFWHNLFVMFENLHKFEFFKSFDA